MINKIINLDNQLIKYLSQHSRDNILKKIKIGFFALIFIIFVFLFYNMSSGFWFPNTDNIQNFVFAKNFANTNSLEFKNELNQKFSPSIFGIRGMVIKDNGAAVPTSMPGYIILLGLLIKISNYLVYLVNPFFAVLALFYLYRISQLIFKDKKRAFLVTILASVSAPFLFVSNVPFNNIVATAIFLAGLYYLLKVISCNKPFSLIDLVYFGIWSGLGLFTRHETIIFYLPAIIYLIIKLFFKNNRKHLKINLLYILLSLFVFSAFLAVFVYIDIKLFNSLLGFLSPAGTILGRSAETVAKVKSMSLLDRIMPIPDMKSFFINLKNQIFLVSPIISMLFVFSWYFIYKEKNNKNLYVILIITVFFQFWFYFARRWSGDIFEGSIGTSLARYLLVSWLIIPIFAVYALDKINQILNIKKLYLMLFLLYFVTNLNIFLFSDMGYRYFQSVRKMSIDNQVLLRQNTPEKSVIFCRLVDRYIYPIRETAIFSTLAPKNRAHSSAKLMKELLQNGYKVYIIDEYQYNHKKNYMIDFQAIIKELGKEKMHVERRNIIPYIYEVWI